MSGSSAACVGIGIFNGFLAAMLFATNPLASIVNALICSLCIAAGLWGCQS